MSSQNFLERSTSVRQNQSAQRIRPSARQLSIFANAVNIPRILEKRGFLQRQQTFEVFKKNTPEYDQGISTQLLIQRRVNEAGRKAIVSETKGLMLIKDLWSQHYHKDILKRSHMNSDTEYFKESTRKLETTANMLTKLDNICMEKFIENDEESNNYFNSLAQNSIINRNDLKLQREVSLIPVRQNDKKLESYDQPDGSMQFFTGNNMSTCSSNPGIYSNISGINKKRNETATSICNYNSRNSCKILGTEDKELQLFPWAGNSARRTSQNSFILEEKGDMQNNPGKVLIEKLENEVKLESDRKRMGITSRKRSSFHKIIGSLLNKNTSQEKDNRIMSNNNSPGKDLKYLPASSMLRHTRTKSSHDSPWMLSRNHVSLEASQQEISTQNILHRRGSTANVSLIVDSRERSPDRSFKQMISKSRQLTAGSVESNMISNHSNLGSRSSSQQRIQSQATLQLREHVGELIKKCERFQSENKQAIAVVDRARVVQNEQDAVNAQKIRELNILSQLNSHTEKKKLMNGNNPRIALAKKRRVQTQYFVEDEE